MGLVRISLCGSSQLTNAPMTDKVCGPIEGYFIGKN